MCLCILQQLHKYLTSLLFFTASVSWNIYFINLIFNSYLHSHANLEVYIKKKLASGCLLTEGNESWNSRTFGIIKCQKICLFAFYCLFWNRVSGCTRTQTHRDVPVSASWMLGLKAYATSLTIICILNYFLFSKVLIYV